MIKDKSIFEFLDALASQSSTPGGGSAAAIMAAMGAALTSMVGNLTVGKEKYADVEEEVRALLQRSESLRAKVTDMVKADIDVFDQVMRSYSMPSETDEEKGVRSEAIQEALKAATDVPLASAKICRKIMNICKPMAEQGNKNVISDSGVSVLAAYAALRSAALNVHINVGGIKDKVFVQQRLEELEIALQGADELMEDIYAIVKARL